jgi:hypothetical protein
MILALLQGQNNHWNVTGISESLPDTLIPVPSIPFSTISLLLTRHLIATSFGIPTPQRRNRYLFGRKLGPRGELANGVILP